MTATKDPGGQWPSLCFGDPGTMWSPALVPSPPALAKRAVMAGTWQGGQPVLLVVSPVVKDQG